MKYIDADKLIAEIKRLEEMDYHCDTFEQSVGFYEALDYIKSFLNSLQQEQQEVNLEEFTEKMNAWKARFNSPDDIPIKVTMAFTARMFYQYPDVARQWYEQLPKATMD